MVENIKNTVIKEYLEGKGSTIIQKQLKIPKRKILKIINDEGILRKRDRCSSLDIKLIDNFYIVDRICPKCNCIVKTKSKDKTIACRNHFKKVSNQIICKSCSLELQVGEGNPFFGKKHTKKSLNKLTKTLTNNPRKFSSSSKPEKIIEQIVKNLGIKVKRTYKINEYICDIYIPKLNLIIEYNGDYWHCNPKKYKPSYFHPHKKKSSQQIWDEDKIRIDNIIKYGYILEVVWETNFDEKTTIQNIIKKYEVQN
jgi:G:T-mismatch repair DNA endonuclease (very short patch repair protein)